MALLVKLMLEADAKFTLLVVLLSKNSCPHAMPAIDDTV